MIVFIYIVFQTVFNLIKRRKLPYKPKTVKIDKLTIQTLQIAASTQTVPIYNSFISHI